MSDRSPEVKPPRNVPIAEGIDFGPRTFVVAAGPCAVESREQLRSCARAVAAAGAGLLRGGAYKPRTSPRSFQGLGRQGLDLLAEAAAETGLPVVTEVLDPRDVPAVAACAAMLQIGSRNMQNVPLLREAAQSGLPVLLKRGASATLDELLAAADYLLDEGNERIVLCERGLRSFDPSTRYLLDLAAVPALKARSPLPVIVDPSHGTGRWDLVAPMARAALAAGADGLMIEVHPEPEAARSDGQQAMLPREFSALMEQIAALSPILGRALSRPTSRSVAAR